MAEAAGVGFVPLEERLPGDLEAWEAAALQHAVGVHDALVREDLTAREAFSALCGDRYRGASECKDGVPAGVEYVVCMSEEEANRCVPMAGPDVTPLLGFQLHGDYSGPLRGVRRLAFSFAADEIDRDFTFYFEKLSSVDFSGVRGVTAINGFFMFGCNLRSFDFALLKVVSIDANFLANCRVLRSVDLRGLENVRSLSEGFMWGCKVLGALDLSPLRSLESIGPKFLASTGLTELDLQALHAIKHIPDYFLYKCDPLESLDFSPLTNTQSIGKGVLLYCTGLRHVSLRGLENVRRLSEDFMGGCKSLGALDLSPLRSLESIGEGFLSSTGITALDLTPLHAIKDIPDFFLSYSDHLESLNFSPLTNTQSIAKGFLEHCRVLRHVSLRGLENVRSVAQQFMEGCASIESLDLRPLQNVEFIAADAFKGCTNLRHVNFSHLRNVREIDLKGFLFGCDALSDESRASAEAFKEECRRRGADRWKE